MALLVILNAYLCHACGGCFVEWDVFCNIMLSVITLSTGSDPQRFLRRMSVIGSLIWVINNYHIRSPLIHALFVQGAGAMVLHWWRPCDGDGMNK